MLFAGGRSKYVCVYDVAEKVLLRRFQVCTMHTCIHVHTYMHLAPAFARMHP